MGAVSLHVNPQAAALAGHPVRHSVGALGLEKAKTLIEIKTAAEQRAYLSPAASFSIAALRSSAFCCERRKTFLSS